MEYYKRGHKHAFNVLVKRGLKESKTRKSTSSSTTASKLNSLLAAHYIAEGMALGPADKKNASVFLSEATDCLNEAEKRISGSGNIDEISLRKGMYAIIFLFTYEPSIFYRSLDVGKEYDRTGWINFQIYSR